MMSRHCWIGICFLALPPMASPRFTSACAGAADQDLPAVVFSGNSGVLVMPAVQVSAPRVVSLSPSPDHRYVLLARDPTSTTPDWQPAAAGGSLPGQRVAALHLALWDRKTQQNREIWTSALPGTHVEKIEWFGSSQTALVLIGRVQVGVPPQKLLLRVTAGTARVEVVSPVPGLAPQQLSVSPSHPRAVITLAEPVRLPPGVPAQVAPMRVLVLDSRGTPTARTALRPGDTVRTIRWTGEGQPVLEIRDPVVAPGHWLVLDTRSGAWTRLPSPPALAVSQPPPAQEPESGVRLRESTVTVREQGAPVSIDLLWLEPTGRADTGRALVARDAGEGWLTPAGDGVFYSSKGALWYQPLLRMSREQLMSLIQRAEAARARARALTEGKLIGIAMHQYAAEHGELPSELNAKLAGYLKDPDVFTRFTLTHAGGKLAAIEKPAETELGFVQQAGGRAVLYVDGHVVWKEDP